MATTLFALCRIIWALCLMTLAATILLLLLIIAVGVIWGIVKLLVQKIRETDLHG